MVTPNANKLGEYDAITTKESYTFRVPVNSEALYAMARDEIKRLRGLEFADNKVAFVEEAFVDYKRTGMTGGTDNGARPLTIVKDKTPLQDTMKLAIFHSTGRPILLMSNNLFTAVIVLVTLHAHVCMYVHVYASAREFMYVCMRLCTHACMDMCLCPPDLPVLAAPLRICQ
eukprot:GHVU01216702.1.p1 GENE.GHVU01216702.1~~GHVU01216702.1.p1  ORF type:complete len:172 (-),score=13.12 GHVU01216702.1:70-585(-)